MQQGADTNELLFRNGTIHLFDDDRTTVESVRFENGVVAAAGTADEVEAGADSPEVIDLGGKTMLPGFNDAHLHLVSLGLDRIETDLSSAESRGEALDALERNAATTDEGAWVLGFGYDESLWGVGEREYLALEELDAVSTNHPIAAVRVDGHTVSLNSAAMDAVDFEGVEYDVITDDGEPTGRVVEDAASRVKDAFAPDAEKTRRALEAAFDRALALGLTSVQTMAGVRGNETTQDVLQRLHRQGDLPIRVTYYAGVDQLDAFGDARIVGGFGDDWLRFGGIKVFSDGSIGAQTAKLGTDFADDPGNDGQLVHTPEELRSFFERAAANEQQLATHAIGDAAIETVLDLYESIADEYETQPPRLRIEHLELPDQAHLDRMAERDVVASMQPNFLKWSREDGLYDARLGPDRLETNNPFKAVLDAGVSMAFGSDSMPPGPLYGIHHAVDAPGDRQRVSVDEAIAAYTRGAAFAEFAETRKGRLEPGMLADAVVLDRDPFDHSGAIEDVEVAMTIVGGEVRYENEAVS